MLTRLALIATFCLAFAGVATAGAGAPAAVDTLTPGAGAGAPAAADTLTPGAGAVQPPKGINDRIAAAVRADAALARADAERLRAQFTPENRRYARMRQVLALVSPLYEIALALLLLVTGLSARMRDLARARFRHRYGRVFVYLALFTAAMILAEAPLSWFGGYWWEHRFGLSNQGLLAWAWEGIEAAGLGLLVAAGTGLVALALAFIERTGRKAWAWLGLCTLPVLLAGVLLQPLVFDPAFNRFTPLENVGLEARLLDLARRAGIPARHVFQVDRSRQTNKLNAYVSGFGPSQRIVLWDTSLKAFREDEILFVMGHEMGHYRLAHIWKGVALWTLLGFGLYFATDRLSRRVLARHGARWRVEALHDEAAIPLLVAMLSALMLVVQPFANAYSRRVEHQADRFGLDVTHANDAAVRAFFVMAARNRSDPDPPPIVRLLLYTHPATAERVRFAREYHPWRGDGAPGPGR